MKNQGLIFHTLFFMVLTIFMPTEVFSRESNGERRLETILRSVARPRLIYPKNKVVNLSNKPSLKFRWGLVTSSPVILNYIEFYLYKGEAVNDKNLVFSKRLANNQYSIEIDSGLFEDGQFYVWGIRQFFLRAEKSNENFILFKVIK